MPPPPWGRGRAMDACGSISGSGTARTVPTQPCETGPAHKYLPPLRRTYAGVAAPPDRVGGGRVTDPIGVLRHTAGVVVAV